MTIQDRNLRPGMRLVARYHKEQYRCEVTEKEGRLGYRLEDGRVFKSPSSAGTAITGKACNGWAFWSVEASTGPTEPEVEMLNSPETVAALVAEVMIVPQDPGSPLAEEAGDVETETMTAQPQATEEAPAMAPAPPREEPPPGKRRFSRVPNQKGVPEGQARWHCYDCGKSFLAPSNRTPEACPLPHPAV